jgi:hypothetical protein
MLIVLPAGGGGDDNMIYRVFQKELYNFESV